MSGIEINKKIVFINSASSAISLLLNLSVLVWLQQFLLKRISPEEYSLIPLLGAVIAFTPLLTMVLTGGLGRYITVAYAKKDTEEVNRISSTMFPILLGSGLVFLAIGLFAAWHIDKILDIPDIYILDAQIMMALLVFLASVRIPFTLFSSGLLIKQKLLLQDIINMGCQFFRIGLLFTLLFGVNVRALWVTLAFVASELLRMIIEIPIALYLIPSLKVCRKAFRWPIAKEIIGYGGWGFINHIGITLKLAMDPLLLNRFSNSTELAIYNVAGIVPRQLVQLLIPITRPFFPIIAAMCATKDYVRLGNTYLRTARYHAWVLIFFSVPVIIFNRELMHLYLDGKYDSSGTIMAILLGSVVLTSFNALGDAVARAAGYIKGIAIRQFIQQFLNLAFTFLFVVFLKKGAYGSAISTLLAGISFEIFIVWPYCRKLAHTTTRKWINKVLFPTLIPAIPSVIVCISIKMFVVIDSWPELFLSSAISGLLYFIIVLYFGLREEDKDDLISLLNKFPILGKILIRILRKH